MGVALILTLEKSREMKGKENTVKFGQGYHLGEEKLRAEVGFLDRGEGTHWKGILRATL